MNYGQFEHCVDGYFARINSQVRIQDQLNHVLGRYIIPAVHEPKKYPKEPYSKEQEREKTFISNTDNDRIARAKMLYGK